MTETYTADTENEELGMSELDMLKQRAEVLGIAYSHRIGLESLRQKIDEKLNGVEPEQTLSKVQQDAKLRKELQQSAMKLVRLRITNLNPDKKDLQGEIFTVANRFIGNVRKFVPYGEVTDGGYHVPTIIYKQLKARKFLSVKTRRGPKGEILVEQNWASEFALEVLPQLTKDELSKLAATQAAAGSV